MALNSADIKFRHSNNLDGTGGIGALIGTAKNAIFPDVTTAQRTAGLKTGRKIWIHLAAPDNSTAASLKACVFSPTAAGDCVVLREVSDRLAEAWDATDTQRIYAIGTSADQIAAGASVLTVTAESAYAATGFQAGDTVLVTDKTSPAAATGAEEYAVIDTVSLSGSTLTITTSAPLTNAYAAGARIASCYEPGAVAPSVTAGSTAAGTTLDTTRIGLRATSIAEDTWTATFTSATAYTLAGARLGPVGSGVVGQPFTGSGAAEGLTILPGAFGGTLANGKTISFTTRAGAVPIWMIRDVPAGTGMFATNTTTIVVECESA